MTRGPRQPLDADECALAASLPRLHGREEPLPGIDAAILSAAHAGVQPSARPRRRSWIVPTSVAASLCLAMGLAWQLRDPAPLPGDASIRTVTESAAGDAADARFTLPPTADQPPRPSMPPPPAGVRQAPPVAAPSMREPAPIAGSKPAFARAPAAAPPTAAAPAPVASMPMPMPAMAPPPPPPPEPASPQAFEANAASARQQSANGVVAPQAKSARSRPEDSERSPSTLDSVATDAPDDEVPPATMDAPQAREAWLRRIRELQQLGKLDEARASLAEFRRRHPDAQVPRDLRSLDPAHAGDPPAD